MYPVHVSNSFLQAPTLSSALYLVLLRFLHRAYEDVSLLTSSVATDTELTPEESQIFQNLKSTLRDFHPDAHACRVKLSLMVMDSPMICPWNIRFDSAKYLSKLNHVSARCRLSYDQEEQLLEHCEVMDVKEGCARYGDQMRRIFPFSSCVFFLDKNLNLFLPFQLCHQIVRQ